MRLDRAWIMRRIPHQGSMCLLDEVVDWTRERIRCRTSSHRSGANPLRARGQLGVACGVEYAAQAMAVHGALLGSAAGGAAAGGAIAPPAPGFLAAVRSVAFHVSRLDDVPGELLCDAVQVAGDGSTAMYEFVLQSAQRRLLDGRATVVLEAGKWMSK